ncbi:alpha-glucosidase/alpha-galactosidase [Anaerocolumna xylanovorans]|uniref:Alpha-galactosidase n=1 Tax=Anaerocolumna xylanovorans DSM 12503 TaxID=1121345 RepID=A0A1M7YNL9_9FIRM|nr:alpha-glucosidase/alpha-galactosidase [Anaerocolumna xylanovorans]SHO54232.1 alpha-galactosidase [Anaerocolumna xylanovorans DSM 12503]
MKITFLGAGSSVFVRNVIGDCMLTEGLHDGCYSLYDIDAQRLNDSYNMLVNINANSNNNRAVFERYVGVENLEAALRNSDFVINAIQVGGYEPCTVTDFEVPKKYGLRQTIADTLGVGGVFRALRTIPVMEMFAEKMEKVCPNALFLNYSNPMGILTGYMLRHTNVKTVGLCHSVQKCVRELFEGIGMTETENIQWKIAGINHMAWLLEIMEDGKDLYPEIKQRSLQGYPKGDKVRHEIMQRFGYYVTESSEHNAEYMPYFIKRNAPELIEKLDIPLDEYPRRCIRHINEWTTMRKELTENPTLTHKKSVEYAANIIGAHVTNMPFKFGGNVINNGLISNLPPEACVEVACIADRSGITPTYVGALPEQCAALNRTNINVQLLAIQAAKTRRKEDVYHAVMLDPHTAGELTLEEITNMCDELFEKHKDWMPEYK